MDPIVSPEKYPPDILRKLKLMPQTPRSIANRWMMGWPRRVKALLSTGEYLDALKAQTERELDVLAETNAPHLSPTGILQQAGIDLEPPATST